MVALICIIGIFIYFFFWTRKVKREEIENWRKIGEVEEKEEVHGRVTHSFLQRKRYYKDYWYFHMEGKLHLESEKSALAFLWTKPAKHNFIIPHLKPNDLVTLRGNRKNQIFYCNSIILHESKNPNI